MLERKIEAREIMYGINTGIGELSEVVLDDEQVKEFQKYLIYNHAAGIGEPFPVEIVRAAMLGRINVHCQGLLGLPAGDPADLRRDAQRGHHAGRLREGQRRAPAATWRR